MARILVAGGLGWDVPVWLDLPLRSGARLRARTRLPPDPVDAGGGLPGGRLGGGAANCAAALVLAGHEVAVAGRVGDDARGRLVLEALSARGLSTAFVRQDGYPTPSALVLVEPDSQRTILSGMMGGSLPPWAIEADAVAAFDPDLVVIRASSPAVPAHRGLVIAHVPGQFAPGFVADVAVGSADDVGPDGARSPLAAVAPWCGARAAVVTNGSQPVQVQDASAHFEVPVAPAPVVDATGAGDIFIAGLADGLLAGADLREAVCHAIAWGRDAVGMEGSAPIANSARVPGQDAPFRRYEP